MRVKLFEYLIILQKKISKRRVIDPFINVVFIICSVLLTNSNEVSFFLFRRSHQSVCHHSFSLFIFELTQSRSSRGTYFSSRSLSNVCLLTLINCQALVPVPLSPSLNITPKTKQTPSSEGQLGLGLTIKSYGPTTLQYTIHQPIHQPAKNKFLSKLSLFKMAQIGKKGPSIRVLTTPYFSPKFCLPE